MGATNSAKATLFLQIILCSLAKNPTVRLSIPEGHHVTLNCPVHDPTDPAPLEWRDREGRVLATKRGQLATSARADKYSLGPDGSLLVQNLHPGDSGEFHCGDQVAADVKVLTGLDYVVSAGRTVLLPCGITDKQTQKWIFRESKQERRIIFIKFRNGTLRKEMEDPRSRFSRTIYNELHISDLQPSDTGEYWCNGKRAAILTVRTEKPDCTTQIAGMIEETDTEADVPENGDPGQESVLMAALIGLCVLILLVVLLIFLLLTRKRYKKGGKQGATQSHSLGPANEAVGHPVTMEPQNETQGAPMVEAGEIHYASLGRQNWRERPRVHGDRHHVIYSTVAGGLG